MSAQKQHDYIIVMRQGETLVPYAPYDYEMILRMPQGKPIRVHVRQMRSLPRHRLYWVLLRQVIKNNTFFTTVRGLHQTLLVGCGVTEPFIDLDGNISMIPSSIAFDQMGEEEFKDYFDAACLIIVTKIMPGTDINLLLQEARSEAKWKEAA